MRADAAKPAKPFKTGTCGAGGLVLGHWPITGTPQPSAGVRLATGMGQHVRQAVRAASGTLADTSADLGLAAVVLLLQAVSLRAFQED